MTDRTRLVRLSPSARVALDGAWLPAAQLATAPSQPAMVERLFGSDGTMLDLDPELAADLPVSVAVAAGPRGAADADIAWLTGVFAGRGYSGIERRRDNGREHAASTHIWEASTARAADAEQFVAILRRHGLTPSSTFERDGRHVIAGEGFEWSLYWNSLGIDATGPVHVPDHLWSAKRDDVLAFCSGVAAALAAADGELLSFDARRQSLAEELTILARRAGMLWETTGTPGARRMRPVPREATDLLIENRQRWRGELVSVSVAGPLVVDGLLLD